MPLTSYYKIVNYRIEHVIGSQSTKIVIGYVISNPPSGPGVPPPAGQSKIIDVSINEAQYIIDILRNESPVMIKFENNNPIIYTDREPIGEGE